MIADMTGGGILIFCDRCLQLNPHHLNETSNGFYCRFCKTVKLKVAIRPFTPLITREAPSKYAHKKSINAFLKEN